MDFKPVKVALIGSGNISYTYLNTLTSGFTSVEVVGCSDLIPERSKARAETFGIRQMTNEQILSDPEIEIVLNTTELWNHSKVTKMILEAGKHAYSEKAMGHTFEGAKANYDLAKEKGLFVGCAPDCYMGAAWQTARKLLDEGYIGRPIVAYSQCMRGYGAMESPVSEWGDPQMGTHGTTITYDMGGYYLNVLYNLFGPVKRASGYSKDAWADSGATYVNTRNPKYGKPYETKGGESVMLGALEFECGVYCALVLCQDGVSRSPEIPRVDIYGTEGVLTLPDPNNFGGWNNQVYISRKGSPRETFKMPFTHGFADTDPAIPTKTGKPEPCHNSWRGVAVVDMAIALRRGRKPRSSAEMALHTVEILDAIDRSDKDNQVHEIASKPERPAMLAPGRYGDVAIMESALDT